MPGPVHVALKTGYRSTHPIRNSQHTSHIVLKIPASNESNQNILKFLRDGGNANSMPEQCRTLLYIKFMNIYTCTITRPLSRSKEKNLYQVQVTERFPNNAGPKKESSPYFRAQQPS